jgi:hypothetical protein
VHDGKLAAMRDEPFHFELTPPQEGLYHGE